MALNSFRKCCSIVLSALCLVIKTKILIQQMKHTKTGYIQKLLKCDIGPLCSEPYILKGDLDGISFAYDCRMQFPELVLLASCKKSHATLVTQHCLYL